jgi:DNA-binding MarR family transcriptional regulator
MSKARSDISRPRPVAARAVTAQPSLAAAAAAEAAPATRAALLAPDALSLGVLADVLGFHVAQAAVTTYGTFERHVGMPFGLRKVEYSLLMLLLANGPLSPKRLGQALALSPPNLTLLLDRLEGRGLVRRERSATDGRSQNIVLTEPGRQLAEASAAAAGTMEDELSDRLSRAERLMLIELLRKVAGR